MASDVAKPAKHGLRITVTMDIPNEDMAAWALGQGFQFASERWYGVTVSRKDNPRARVSCRTTRLRKPKEKQ